MKVCFSCMWVNVVVLWNRLFPVRAQLRRIELTLAALAQTAIHTHNMVNKRLPPPPPKE